MLCYFRNEAKKKRSESDLSDADYEVKKAWVVLETDWEQKFGVRHTVWGHLNKHSNLKLKDFVRFCLVAFTYFQTKKDKLEAWMNVGTLLFCDTKEGEELHQHPFSKSLHDVLEDVIKEEVKERVESALRIEELKRMTDAIKD